MDDSEKKVQKDFRDPPARYRGAPFWAWNCELRREELTEQIGYFREMGFGGFHMHVRSGLSIPYMGEEFLALTEDCVRRARELGLEPRLYDEDRWPSGFAGGLVTKPHPEYRRRSLRFAPDRLENAERDVMRFDIALNPDGTLRDYRLLSDGEPTAGEEWFAQVVVDAETPRFNNATYVDTLNPEAVRCFVGLTYEKFRERLGQQFGKEIPSVFTDEPQFTRQTVLPFSHAKQAVTLAWTDDLPRTFLQKTGTDLIAALPELVWNLPGDAPSQIRYLFHDHLAERFSAAYADTVGDWCDRAGILFTGHVLSEATLRSQTEAVGEAMRFYRSMSLPGIDMLCGYHEYNTAKQAQSAVRQYGRAGMMSELYGVLGWDLDFRGHKHHGDWQAALGVTLRVPHLSWVSMKGEAKRDYPQSIFYQSPWYRHYPLIENHFARVNLAMTQGEPVCRIAVIHPIESEWLRFGASDRNSEVSDRLERQFAEVTEWLLFGGLDFDFLCESTLPALCPTGANPLPVGKCTYDAVVVPGCLTLRETTLRRLEAFQEQGGTLIFMGELPSCVDARPDPRPAALAARSTAISFSRDELLRVLSPFREVTFRNSDGRMSDDLIYRMQKTGEGRWVFIAHGRETAKPDIPRCRRTLISFPGSYAVTLYDTLTGAVRALCPAYRGGETVLSADLYEHDSLLLRLTPLDRLPEASVTAPAKPETVRLPVRIPSVNAYTLSEPNPLLLDRAEYALDGEPWQPEEELLRIDNLCRKRLGWSPSGGGAAQPWCIPEEPARHRIALRFRIRSEISADSLLLALEHPENTAVSWNGKPVIGGREGFYVDHDIPTLRLPALEAGENILCLTMPFEKRVPLEWCYLLGEFGVRVTGTETTVVRRAQTLGFGSITGQTLPFYSGTVTYHIPFTADRAGTLKFQVPQYRAAVLEWKLDDGEPGLLAFSPYEATMGQCAAGPHILHITAYLNRTNTFGPLHNADRKETWLGPNLWRTQGVRWCYEYELQEEGILHSPSIWLEIPQEPKE